MRAHLNESVKPGDLLRVLKIEYDLGKPPVVILERVTMVITNETR